MPLEQRPSIVHFSGRRKRWLASTLDVNAGFYDAYRSRTQFARKPREKTRDAVLHSWAWSWAWSKRFLKQYKLISLVYKFLTRSRSADRASA